MLLDGPGGQTQPSLAAGHGRAFLKSDMAKICPTLDWSKKAGFETKMDIKLTIVLPFDLKMAADTNFFVRIQP